MEQINMTTSVNVANAVTKLVACEALPMLLQELTVGNLVHRDFEPVEAKVGDAVIMPGLDPKHGIPITLASHIEATVRIPDVTKVLAVPQLLGLYLQAPIIALAEHIETKLLALHSQFNNEACGFPGVPITIRTMDFGETRLFNGRVPMAANKYFVLHWAEYNRARALPAFREYATAGEAGLNELVSGPVAKLRDMFILRSQYVQKTQDPATTHNLAFAKQSMCLAIRRPPPLPKPTNFQEYAEIGSFGLRVSMDWKPDTVAQEITLDMLYGCGVLRNEWGVQILT